MPAKDKAKETARHAAYVQANRDHVNEYHRAYYAAHREDYRERQRRYYADAKDSREAQRRIETYVVYAGVEVVYVGRTDCFVSRMANHRWDKSPWMAEMTEIAHRYHGTYADSLVDEALLIRLWQPKYDTEGVTK